MPFATPQTHNSQFSLSLDSYIVSNPASTFFVRAEGDSMREDGIFSGDLLVVDRLVEPSRKHIVLAVVDGDFAVKRFLDLNIAEESECYVWGVVIGTVHRL